MIKVLTHYTANWANLMDVTLPILERYCEKNGYQLSVFKNTPYDTYTGKEKIRQVLSVCEDGDIALVLDADTIITNPEIRVEGFINDNQDFYITNHVGKVNSGVFIVRLSTWSRAFLNFLLSVIGMGWVHCEQDAIVKYLNEYPNDKKICILPHPSINSLMYQLYPEHKDITTEEEGNWTPNHLLLHLPGVGMDKRLEILTKIKETL